MNGLNALNVVNNTKCKGHKMKAWCIFEQSGTFRDAFKNLGFESVCVDIRNDYNQTDIILDLFSEIDKACMNLPSFFDNIDKDNIVFSFFPCIRFTEKTSLNARCKSGGTINKSDFEKLCYSSKLINETAEYYRLFCALFKIALNRGFKMVVENPYNTAFNFLKTFFPLTPQVIITNRAEYGGDYFKKPTAFWFVNFEPQNNTIFENVNVLKIKAIQRDCGKHGGNKLRSEISPSFADRFIREFVQCAEKV